MAATLWPAATASPAADKTSICQAYQAEETKQTKANAKLTKLLETGKWTAGKKALVSTASQESDAEKQFAGVYLKGAPRTVKAAAAVALKLDATLRNVVAKAKSLGQYEKRSRRPKGHPRCRPHCRCSTPTRASSAARPPHRADEGVLPAGSVPSEVAVDHVADIVGQGEGGQLVPPDPSDGVGGPVLLRPQ